MKININIKPENVKIKDVEEMKQKLLEAAMDHIEDDAEAEIKII